MIKRPRRPDAAIVGAQNIEIDLDPTSRLKLLPAAQALAAALRDIGIEAQEVTFNASSTNAHAMHILVGPKRYKESGHKRWVSHFFVGGTFRAKKARTSKPESTNGAR